MRSPKSSASRPRAQTSSATRKAAVPNFSAFHRSPCPRRCRAVGSPLIDGRRLHSRSTLAFDAPAIPAAILGAMAVGRSPLAQRVAEIARDAPGARRFRLRLPRAGLLAFFLRPQFSLPVSARGQPAFPAPHLSRLRVFLHHAGVFQPDHRLLDALQEPRDNLAALAAAAP